MNIAYIEYSIATSSLDIFVTGCNKPYCKDCYNAELFDFCSGDDWRTHMTYLNSYLTVYDTMFKNIFLLGGSPNHQKTEDISCLLGFLHRFNKDIWLYTGYTWEQILIQDQIYEDHEVNSPSALDVVKYCDVIVDGPYMEELRDTTLAFRGSSNQRIIDVKNTLKVMKFKPNRIVTLQ